MDYNIGQCGIDRKSSESGYYNPTYQQQMELFNLDRVADMVVRPARQTYRKNDLERINLNINQIKYHRHDFRISIRHDQYIECSLFSQFPHNPIQHIKKCMIYLHCNSGCRVQGLPYVAALLKVNIPVVVFDFRGSGMSSGEYISMGFHESEDIDVIIGYLKERNPAIEIGLWGRSMGAVAAMHYCARKNNVCVAILDSPFISLQKMMVKIGKTNTIFPGFIISLFLSFLNPYLYEKSNFYIQDINNIQLLKYIRVPLLFVTSTKDKVVGTQDVQTLYRSHQGQKQIIYITKDHHQLREKGTIEKIVNIGKNYFESPEVNNSERLGDILRNRRYTHEKQSIREMMTRREMRL